jgi:hypothetical protein
MWESSVPRVLLVGDVVIVVSNVLFIRWLDSDSEILVCFRDKQEIRFKDDYSNFVKIRDLLTGKVSV